MSFIKLPIILCIQYYGKQIKNLFMVQYRLHIFLAVLRISLCRLQCLLKPLEYRQTIGTYFIRLQKLETKVLGTFRLFPIISCRRCFRIMRVSWHIKGNISIWTSIISNWILQSTLRAVAFSTIAVHFQMTPALYLMARSTYMCFPSNR